MPKVYNKRKNGYPKDAIYVGRPSLYGNPFTVKEFGRGGALTLYKEWMETEVGLVVHIKKTAKDFLKGKDLLCWCAPEPCHADILLRIANE